MARSVPRRWNIARKQAHGEKFLRMAGVADVEAASALWRDPSALPEKRCLAARALGLLGKRGPKWMVDGVEDDESPLGRARSHGKADFQKRRLAEIREQQKQAAMDKMRELGSESVADVIRLLLDSTVQQEKREAAAFILRGWRSPEAVEPLIEVLAEGKQNLANACMWALVEIGSRRGSRRLMRIVRGKYPLAARQEAVYALWQVGETRAECLFIQVCGSLDTEEEYTRDMATEALGNTAQRLRTQKALRDRLFDPSMPVRYAALCACSRANAAPWFLREALMAKLDDPGRVDDDRVIAKLAAQLLMQK